MHHLYMYYTKVSDGEETEKSNKYTISSSASDLTWLPFAWNREPSFYAM